MSGTPLFNLFGSESYQNLNPSIIIVRYLNIIKKGMFVLIILTLPLLSVEFSYAEESDKDKQLLISRLSLDTPDEFFLENFMQLNVFSVDTNNNSITEETEFVYLESQAPEVNTEKLKKENILKAVPSISTEDNKTLGLLIPPFAYFAKKF